MLAYSEGPSFSDIEKSIRVISHISGYLSLFVWLFAQLPQIIENYLNQSVSGVSILFLGCWMSGDLTNLVGCLLTSALPFQTSLASYYCFIDCILALQYWYYTRVYPYQKVHHNMLQSPNMMRSSQMQPNELPMRVNRFKQLSSPQRSPLPNKSPRQKLLVRMRQRPAGPVATLSWTQKLFATMFVAKSQAQPVNPEPKVPSWVRTVIDALGICTLSVSRFILNVHKEDIGRVLAWMCLVLYVSSRAPQILENYRKRSTKGISLYLFLFAMLGNSLYTICVVSDLVLIYNDNGYMDDWPFRDALMSQLPFIVGAAGTVLFDLVILWQCWFYALPGDHHSLHSPRYHNHRGHPHHRISSPNTKSHDDHFRTPDWYVGNHQFSSPEINKGLRNNMHQRPLSPASETASLLHMNHLALYSNMLASSPVPHHYIVSSSDSSHVVGHTGENIFTHTLHSISNSFSRRHPAVAVPTAVPSSTSSSLKFSGNSALSTSMIPLIIGVSSSVSKKMKDLAKVPFLPIDFLYDDFHSHQNSKPDLQSSK